jgi:hypothetical protein
MADPKRLGKRGAYRLGELRGAEPKPPKAPGPHRPAFGARHPRRSILTWLITCAAVAALLGVGAALGLWWLPFPVGLAAGVGPRRFRPALGLAVLGAAVGWGAALWWPALSGAPVSATARAIAALAGLPPHAWTGVAAALLLAILQSAGGFWLARAVRAVMVPSSSTHGNASALTGRRR